LEVQSLIYTFSLSNPQLTPSHETLVAILTQNQESNAILRQKIT
jgi:hypothetical protein